MQLDTMMSVRNYFNCNQLQINFLILGGVVLYCGLTSTSEDLVQVDVPLAVSFLWPHTSVSKK